MTPWVAGADGCPGGWVVVLHPVAEPDKARVVRVATFRDLLALTPEPKLIAIDIPIGLPDRIGPGGRECDIAARRVLGQRQSAVFAMPSRAAVMCDDYRAACTVAFATSDPPRKISKQAFNLFPKVREVDLLMTPALQERVREVHPEVAFWVLNGRSPLSTPKKIKSRPNPEGLAQRAALLSSAGYDRAAVEHMWFPRHQAGADDIIDAFANASAAVRILQGCGVRFPDAPARDGRGLKMEISG